MLICSISSRDYLTLLPRLIELTGVEITYNKYIKPTLKHSHVTGKSQVQLSKEKQLHVTAM